MNKNVPIAAAGGFNSARPFAVGFQDGKLAVTITAMPMHGKLHGYIVVLTMYGSPLARISADRQVFVGNNIIHPDDAKLVCPTKGWATLFQLGLIDGPGWRRMCARVDITGVKISQDGYEFLAEDIVRAREPMIRSQAAVHGEM